MNLPAGGKVVVSDKKRLRKVVKRLPFDCWCEISLFIGEFKEIEILFLTIKGLYEYIKFQNSLATKNTLFKAFGYPIKGIRYPHVKHIKFNGDNRKCQTQLKNASSTVLIRRFYTSLENLETLHLKNTGTRTETKKLTIGKELQHHPLSLKKLSMTDFEEEEINIHSDFLPNLESIELQYSRERIFDANNYNVELLFFAKSNDLLPRLKELTLRNLDVLINPEYEKQLKLSLTSLTLDMTGKVMIEDHKITNFPNLLSLCVAFLQNLTEISALPNLKYLSAKTVSRSTSDPQTTIKYPTINKDLEHIKICGNEYTGFITKRFKNLISFEILHSNWAREDINEVYKLQELTKIKSITCSSEEGSIEFTKIKGLENLDLALGKNDISIDIGLLKPTLRKMKIIEKNNLFMLANFLQIDLRVGSLQFHQDSKKMRKGRFDISDFPRLEELEFSCFSIISDSEINKNQPYFYIQNNNNLRKISLHYPLEEYKKEFKLFKSFTTPPILINNLPRLNELVLGEDICELLEIKNCPSLRKYFFKKTNNCESKNIIFPKGIGEEEKSRITELIFKDDEERVIDGDIFRSLKYLKIIRQNVSTKKEYTLKNLTSLWRLEIHVPRERNEWWGIKTFENMSERVDVVLCLLNRNGRVVRERSMDKKGFIKYIQDKRKVLKCNKKD